MNNNDIFLNLYNTLDDVLKEKYNVKDETRSYVTRRINELKRSPLLKDQQRGEKLDIIRNLRNSLVHIEKFDNEDNFTINDSLIETLKEEIADINKPKMAINICTSINDVLSASLNDKLFNVTNLMNKYGFTHIPILKDGYLYGVFSQNTIFTYFSKHKGIIANENDTIDKFIDLLPIEKHITEHFDFVSRYTKVEELIPMFNKKERNVRLVMLFVTENGHKDERVLGIITSYDLLCK